MMPTLVLDATQPDTLLVGYKDGSTLKAKRLPLATDRRQALVGTVEKFLHFHKHSINDITALVVVNGPGRFSSLRMMSVVANLLHWDRGVQLAVARSAKQQASDPVAAVRDILRRSRPAVTVTPYYGKPAHITKPKRRK